MGIQNPIISAGPTQRRITVYNQPVHAASAVPGETYTTVDADGARETVTVSADYQGQVYFQRLGTERPFQYTMHVVIDIEGTLTWVPADLTVKTDQYSGRRFDPMA